jgi:hypothetical protein
MSPKPAVVSLFFTAFLFTAPSAGATDTLSVIHKFLGGSDGDDPSAVIQASDGNFYGTTYLSVGTVFKVTPGGQFTTLFVATHNSNRYFYGDFFTSVVEGPDGFLYVISRGSNSNPNSTLFRISKSGTDYRVVLEEAPNSLSVASDGNFYGADGNGIFRLTTGGAYTVLTPAGTGGITQSGFGKQASDGNFYGICSVANVSGPPHVCRVTISGQVTPIFQFPSGRWPANGVLTQGSDGFLYGAAWKNNYTSELIFQLSTSGSYREIYNSPNNCTPKSGCSTVIQASDGNLWITNPPGQSVYSITPTGGALLQTVSFSAIGHPQLLIQAPSGILYGTTGEPNPAYYDAGTVFSLNAGLPPAK